MPSKLWVPGDPMPREISSQTPMAQIRAPRVAVPGPLQDDLAANPELRPNFDQAISKAMNAVLNTPDVAPRILNGFVLQELQQRCYDALVVMRRDLKWPLRRCFDVLPATLVESLRQGIAMSDLASKHAEQKTWQRGDARPTAVEVDKKDLKYQDEEDHIASDIHRDTAAAEEAQQAEQQLPQEIRNADLDQEQDDPRGAKG